MSYHVDDEVIDLTRSFTIANSIYNYFVNVINLDTDESIVDLNSSAEQTSRVHKGKQIKKKPTTPHMTNYPKVHCDDTQSSAKLSHSEKKHTFGECPICWDELGKNRLAATKCGHVFCRKCLKQSLKVVKKCPTCRQVLKNKSDHHPLYLSRN